MISQKTIDEIFQTVQIEDIVSDFVNLKNSGSNLKGLCPFHSEKTPSFMVSPSKNIFKCFGCGRGGNAIHFLIEHEGLSYPEALKHVADKYQIEIEEIYRQDDSPDLSLKKDSLFLINQFAAEYYQKNLFESREGQSIGMSYFKERGFLEKTLRKFQLGYALKDGKDLMQTALKLSYKKETLQELGLITQNEFDFFRERVIFPIHNLSGKVVAFGARNLNSEIKTAKYLNSPESEIYNKSLSLYGIYFAKQAIRKSDECLLVEGYTDVISLHQNGIENAVASSGTSLTEGQVRMIKRFTSNIKILFDADPAGLKAASRGIDIILRQDLNVKIVTLPASDDPDSFIRKYGYQKFVDYLSENEQDFLVFKAKQMAVDAAKDPIRKTKFLKEIVTTIALIPDPLKRSIYAKECSRQLDVDEAILGEEINKAVHFDLRQQRLKGHDQRSREYREEPRGRSFKSGKAGLSQVMSDDYVERHIVRNLINYGNKMYDETEGITMAAYIIANIQDVFDHFENPLYHQIVIETIERVEKTDQVDHNFFVNHINPEISRLSVDLLYTQDDYAGWEKKGLYLQTQKLPDDNYIRDTHQAILRLKDRKLCLAEIELKKRIKTLAPENAEEKTILLKTIQKIKAQRSSIHNDLGTVVPVK